MLKNRQEGLTNLHRFLITFSVLGLFYLYWRVVDLTRVIDLVPNLSFRLYFFSVLAGLLISLRAYSGWAQVLANISWRESYQLTKHQMIRLSLVLFAVIFALSGVPAELNRVYCTCMDVKTQPTPKVPQTIIR